MPWIVLAFLYVALYARLTRTNVLDTLSENFMRTARAKGLAPGLILRRHALRPSLTPLVTLFGMDVATLLGGALITETVFGLNGVGKLAFDAIASNDQPIIMGVTLLAAFFVVIANIVVDLLYRFLDPRLRTVTR
jgi:peptide/nickel transport system permease protein